MHKMKKMKIISAIFWVISALLTNAMFANVAYNYSSMVCGIEYKGFSAPASAAFLVGIPYLIGIIICAVLAIVFQKKSKQLT